MAPIAHVATILRAGGAGIGLLARRLRRRTAGHRSPALAPEVWCRSEALLQLRAQSRL
jgi:hypothetical protein